MRRISALIMLVAIILTFALPVFAESSDEADISTEPYSETELSPMSGDVFNVILVLVCISGSALIIILLLTLTSKK